MIINGTIVMRLLAEEDGRYLLYEWGAPYRDDLKGDFISLRLADGRLLPHDGRAFGAAVEVSKEVFGDLLGASFIESAGKMDEEGREKFVLSVDGLARAVAEESGNA